MVPQWSFLGLPLENVGPWRGIVGPLCHRSIRKAKMPVCPRFRCTLKVRINAEHPSTTACLLAQPSSLAGPAPRRAKGEPCLGEVGLPEGQLGHVPSRPASPPPGRGGGKSFLLCPKAKFRTGTVGGLFIRMTCTIEGTPSRVTSPEPFLEYCSQLSLCFSG